MSHIEFIGPPGAGKSTIHAAMLSKRRLYGGTEEDAIERAFLDQSRLRHRSFYRLLPSSAQEFYKEKYLRHRFERSAFDEFIDEFPEFIHTLSAIMKSVEHQRREIYYLCKHACERYQLGISTKREGELLCLDESFCQRAVSVLWRSGDRFPLEEYFETTPTPAALVHIDAPPGVCVTRQREREAVTIAEPWVSDVEEAQEEFREACFTVSDYATSKGIPLIRARNVGSVESTLSEIENEIPVVD